eukprot:TRINITY_DN5812_c0_g1_i10.p1 TRINITY_DN5812_c0_g1~~TRINITY_DN5812_c0_g1_i10.p1  ORF type:complete len:343 (+),score=63.41 TRINITY_DN5812_c0_g1_i10:333-1361(+)
MHVLGAGALGCLFAARLARARVPTTLLLRPGSSKAVNCLSAGRATVKLLERRDASAQSLLRQPQSLAVDVLLAHDSAAGSPAARSIQTLLVATKAYGVVDALKALEGSLADDAVVFLLCNGALAVYDELQASAPSIAAKVVLGTTSHGALTSDDFEVEHTGVGDTWLGRQPGVSISTPEYEAALAELGRAELGANDEGEAIVERLWLKLAANCVLNPFTALAEVRNGDVLASEERRNQARKICHEVASVAAAATAVKSESASGSSQLSADAMLRFVNVVAEQTAANRSSMLQDVTNRRRTEVDYLNGWVASKGAALGLDVSVNAFLAQEVRKQGAAYLGIQD